MDQGVQTRVAVIIEDDPDVSDLLEIVLTQSGYDCKVARNGVDGLEAVQQHDPILTTLDVSMPGMDGFAVARRIRDFSSTYLIMITALNDEIDVVMGLEAGADDYLVKPFRPRELRARAESMLRRPRRGPGTAARSEGPAPTAQDTSEETRSANGWAREAVKQFSEGNRATIGEVPDRAPRVPDPRTAAIPAETDPLAAPAASGDDVAPPAPSHRAESPGEVSGASTPTTEAPRDAQAGTPASRMAAGAHAHRPAEDGWVRLNGLALNPETRIVLVDGRGVDVSRVEFDLLASLMSTGRRVRSKADLVLTMRGQDYVTAYFVNEADKRTVEGHIEDLRRKLRDDGAVAKFVEPVRGVGFRMAAEV